MGIAEKIAERLAWLSYPSENDSESRRRTFNEMKSIYRIRSKAVHGVSGMNDSQLALGAREAEELASLGVFAFAQLPTMICGKKEKDLDSTLTEFFTSLKMEGLPKARTIIECQGH